MAIFKAVLVILILLAAISVGIYESVKAPNPNVGPTVTLAGATYRVEIADTPAKQELGLGQRDSLAQGHGMLFVFPAPGNWGFWMKDTRFPLDIIWARSDGTIITIERNVATSTYAETPPRIFYPAEPNALYVLEVNAGAAAPAQPGDRMTITY